MIDKSLIEQGVKLILAGIGVDQADANFLKTPERVARMYEELLTPRENNYQVFPEKHANMILLRDHHVVGLCPHHLAPVTMRVWLAYIPSGQVLGLSKLARTIESQLTAPIMQETLTDAIADELDKRLKPKGVACIVSGKHGCMQLRGVRTPADVVTSAVRGVFLADPSAKAEFLSLVGQIP